MTSALCIACGRIKFGALCECTHCGAAAEPDHALSIALSSHRLSMPALLRLGRIIEDLTEVCGDPSTRTAAFKLFMRDHMRQPLELEIPADLEAGARKALDAVTLPTVTISSARPSAGPRLRSDQAASPGRARDAIDEAIVRLVANEDPARPLSDRALVQLLAEQGHTVLRRHVARRRDRLGILSSSKRRRDDG